MEKQATCVYFASMLLGGLAILAMIYIPNVPNWLLDLLFYTFEFFGSLMLITAIISTFLHLLRIREESEE